MSEGIQSVATSSRTHEATDATTARIALPAEGFALSTLFERIPDAHAEIKSAVATPDSHALLVIRTDASTQETATALCADPSVTTAEYLTDRRSGWVFRVAWSEQPRRFLRRVLAEDATILSAQGQNDKWAFRLLLPDRDALTRAYEAIEDCECGAELERIGTYGDGGGKFVLTDEQREALVAAFEAGYYDIPRDLTAAELAEKIGISHQALSERFRRGYGTLVAGIVAGGREHE